MTHTSLKQNMVWLRTLAGLVDEKVYETSVDVLRQGDILTLQLVARHREGNKTETHDTAQRLKKSLHKWKSKIKKNDDKRIKEIVDEYME